MAGSPEQDRSSSSWSIRQRNAQGQPEITEPEQAPQVDAAPAPPARRWWVWIGVPFVVLLLLGTTLGISTLFTTVTPEDCLKDETFHPIEERCVQAGPGGEVCKAWMRRPQSYTPAQCPFRSEDGRVAYTIAFAGSGSVHVAFETPDGENVYYRTWGEPGVPITVDETVKGLRGPSGTWTLKVVFIETTGTADIVAYG